jgi:GNAT superfamily N-acetyltransferase
MCVFIERAKVEDAQALHFIQKEAFRSLYKIYNDLESPFLQSLNRIIEKISDPDGTYFKILYDKIICGGVYLFHLEDTVFKVGIIYILPEYQHQKIGARAIKLAEQTSPSATEWEVDFPLDLHKNEKFYRLLSYIDTGRREVINENLTLAFYRKKVVTENGH